MQRVFVLASVLQCFATKIKAEDTEPRKKQQKRKKEKKKPKQAPFLQKGQVS